SIQAPATFSAKALGIKPQPIEVRLWAEDYLPGRERTYSPPHVFFVLTPEQHALWITEQLSKWHRASLEVRDREMALHETNKQLRAATPEELASGEMRKQLQRQAAAEADNSRKLAALSKHGEELLRQAARNPEMGVGHLDRWAEMLQILNDIATNRMPSVSDLLAQASTEPRSGKPSTPSEPTSPGEPTSPDKNTSPGKNTSPRTPTSPEKNTLASKPSSPAGEAEAKPAPPAAGMQRTAAAGSGKPPEEVVASSKLTVPQVTDVESSLQPNEPQAADDQPPKKKYDGTRMGLAQTVLSGPARKSDGKPNEAADEQPEDDSTVGKAVWEQEELLAEFERVADELNTVLANLEGSTLVKRLKAAAREQTEVADRIGSRIDSLFGLPAQSEGGNRKVLDALAQAEEASSQKVSYIMDDMQSYFERRRMNQFKFVLDDMRNSDVIGALREIGEKLPAEGGLSIAQTEYWADTLDRWAEDLVDPACAGNCPGAKDSDSLPPSVILEVLQILEGEVNLREATRVAEQAKAANSEEQHAREADGLGQTQEEIRLRTDKVVERIQEMPEGSDRFAKEISLLGGVSQAMLDARDLLMAHDTGSPAMASETDAIELLLQSKRINPKAGGGGGTGPGGGGTGTTQDSALALLGSGLNQNEKREARDVSQATGEAGRVLPEEFRAGLDEYFQRLESGQTGQTGTPPRHEDTTEER
ncbi:MAG: hypothetical protein ACTHK7_19525, partial [Aureliella sp.]